MLHKCMPRDTIQGQSHETFNVRNSSIFKVIFFSVIYDDSWQVSSDS